MKPAPYGFPRAARLLNAGAYSAVFQRPRRWSGPFFTALYRMNDCSAARLGLAIGKRHNRLAHSRNRLKRIVRESFRRHREALKGVDIVIMARADLRCVPNQELFETLSDLWRQLAGHRVPEQR